MKQKLYKEPRDYSKNYLKGLEKQYLALTQGREYCSSPAARVANFIINRALATILRRTFLQSWEIIFSNLNASMDQTTKSEKQNPDKPNYYHIINYISTKSPRIFLEIQKYSTSNMAS